MMAVYFGFSFLIFWVSFIHSCIFVNASHMFMCFISNTSSYCHIHYAHLKTGSLTQKRKHSLLQRSFLKRFIVFFSSFYALGSLATFIYSFYSVCLCESVYFFPLSLVLFYLLLPFMRLLLLFFLFCNHLRSAIMSHWIEYSEKRVNERERKREWEMASFMPEFHNVFLLLYEWQWPNR